MTSSARGPTAAAIITAAGSSRRMQGKGKKEFLLLDKKPVLRHSIDTFLGSHFFTKIIITLPEDQLDALKKRILDSFREIPGPLSTEETHTLLAFCPGGNTRCESVYAGLTLLRESPPDLVLIHDGARPGVSRELIRSIMQNADTYGGAVPGLTPVDAVKKVDGQGFVTDHLSRMEITGVQTPQGFQFTPILEAHRRAHLSGTDALDDSELFCRSGGKVKVIPGDRGNRKITYQEDLQ